MRILITGASSGLGRAMAKRLARKGAQLALCAPAPAPELESIVAECVANGAAAIALTGDLSLSDVPRRLVDGAVGQFGGLDGLVSNAGIIVPGTLCDMDEAEWDKVFAVNLRSAWMLARAAYPHLRTSRGAMVAVASMSGIGPYPGGGAYSPSKAALIMLVRQLAQEWAADGIRVNAVSPGLFSTAMAASVYADPQKKAAREALVPLRRIGDPQRDLAGLVEFLLSSDATYLTGQNIVVDGGLLGSVQASLAGGHRASGAAR